jgi:hypothetical protein
MMDCEVARASSCQVALYTAQSNQLIGAFVPRCEADGTYSSMQCHASTGQCWCVTTDGTEIASTRRSAGTRPDCAFARMTPCQLELSQVSASTRMGQFRPSCEADGSYSSKQCHGSTGYCWCVDSEGEEVKGTRTRSATLTC